MANDHSAEVPNENLYFQVLNESSVPFVITDPRQKDNPIVYVNPAFLRVTGYTFQESIGRNCRFLQGNDSEQTSRGQLASAIQGGLPCEAVIRNYKKNGELFWNKLYVYPIKNSSEGVTHFVGIQYDITASVRANQSLAEKNDAIEKSLDIYLKVKSDGTVLEANKAFFRVFGWAPSELIGHSAFILVPEILRVQARTILANQINSEPTNFLRFAQITKDGRTVEVEWSLTTTEAKDAILCFGRDISERATLLSEVSQSEKRLSMLLESITEGFLSLSSSWQILYINTAGAQRLDKAPQDLIGKNIWDEFPDAVGGIFYETYHKAMESSQFHRCESFYVPLQRWFEARAYPSSEGLTVLFQDVTDRKNKEQELIHSSTHDSLTGLINRAACLNLLNNLMEVEKRGGNGLTVLFMNLDRFKEVNDAYGHGVGDKVLRLLGERLQVLKNEQVVCARISGDEFLFVMKGAQVEKAEFIAEKLLSLVSEPMRIEELEIVIGCSIGIATDLDSSTLPDVLINRADTAMYAAKNSGRYNFKFATSELTAWDERRHKLRKQLLPALHSQEFILHYQPQVDLHTLKITGAEALIRWQHPELGMLPPSAFISLAEESPMILELGEWVLNKACQQLALWEEAGHSLKISFNASPRQLRDVTLVDQMEAITSRYQLPKDCLKMEVTESMLVQDYGLTSKVLDGLRNKGYRIALDDFGTGYSNFSYLKQFPITAIKIDRSFLSHIDTDRKALAIIEGMIALAKSLELTVICEGVETQRQLDILRGTDCDHIQGHYISMPLPPEELFTKFLQ